MEKSIWDTKKEIHFKPLDKNINTDILIIGGGLTGITLAYYLKDSKMDVTLIEQTEIGYGVTRRTTGKLTYLQEDLYQKINKIYNINYAKEYYNSQKDAIKNIVKIIKQHNIDCDLVNSPSIIFSKNKQKIIDNQNIFDQLNIPYYNEALDLPFKNCLYVKDTYVFHPIKYLYELTNIIKDKINIYEHIKMINYKHENDLYIVDTDKAKITCKYLVFCNHYPPFIFPYLFPMKTYLEKSDVYIYPTKNLGYNAINLDKETISIRFQKDKMLYLTNSRKLGSNKKVEVPDNYEYMWSNFDIITSDYLPIAGRLKDNLFLVTGFNTWGMTNSNICSKVVSDIILNKENKYINLFKPDRKPSLIKDMNIINNGIHNAYTWTKSKFNTHKIVKKDGKKYGIYIDSEGKEHVVDIICPHMKCSLKFNEKDTTWDCICHGSIFDIDGKVIKGPSTKCIKKRD